MKKRKRSERGSIQQRDTSKYLIRFRRNGKQLSRVVNGDYALALAELSKELTNTPPPEPPAPERTFASYMELEWAQYVRDKWKASTQTTQGRFVHKHIRPFFDDMLLSKIKPVIKPVTIAAFHAAMEAKGLGKKTRRTLHAILSCMFSYAVDIEVLDSSPVKKRLAPELDDPTEKPALTEQQLLTLFEAVPVRTKAFYMVLGLTGIRCGEALGLKWADVDFASHELNIRRAIYRGQETTPKTSSSLRPRPIMPKLARALLSHKQMAHYTTPTDYVFASSTGNPMNPDQLRETLQAALKGMGITFPPRADGLHLLDIRADRWCIGRRVAT